MNHIINDYLDSTESAAQFECLMDMANDFQYQTEFVVSNSDKTQFNDLPF